jgi:hypothetical protein
MGFDAFLQIHLSFEKGRPYFFNPGLEREFDLTKIPRIPEEFQCFETLRGWSYGALLSPEPNEMEVDLLSLRPSYEKMVTDPTYTEGDISLEEFHHFVKFCEWVRSTDVEFKYMLSY